MELLSSSAGGVGYLLKDSVSNVDEFVAAVRRVARGGSAIDPSLVAELFSRQRRADPLAELTPREREALVLMAQGRSNAGIASELCVTEGAVEKYVKNVLAKLEIQPDELDHRRVLAVLTYLDAGNPSADCARSLGCRTSSEDSRVDWGPTPGIHGCERRCAGSPWMHQVSRGSHRVPPR